MDGIAFCLKLKTHLVSWCHIAGLVLLAATPSVGVAQQQDLARAGHYSPRRETRQFFLDNHPPTLRITQQRYPGEPFLVAFQPWTTEFLPRGNMYGTYWASVAEPKLSTTFSSESDAGHLVDSHIAGRLGLFKYGIKDRPVGFQLDILGSGKLRQDTGEFDVLATDYRYDILGIFSADRHRFKFGLYHVSSHLGDEFLLKNPDFDRLNYTRDSLVAGYSYYASPSMRWYGEIGYAFSREISEPWEFQFDFDYGPRSWTGLRGAPFVAANIHLREEVGFGGNGVVQAGWAWRGADPTGGTLRLGIEYYNGKSRQFSFFNEHEQQFGFGIWYDF